MILKCATEIPSKRTTTLCTFKRWSHSFSHLPKRFTTIDFNTNIIKSVPRIIPLSRGRLTRVSPKTNKTFRKQRCGYPSITTSSNPQVHEHYKRHYITLSQKRKEKLRFRELKWTEKGRQYSLPPTLRTASTWIVTTQVTYTRKSPVLQHSLTPKFRDVLVSQIHQLIPSVH